MEIDIITEEDMQLIENKINKDIKDLQEAVHIIKTSLDTINKMLKMLSDKVYVPIEPAPDIGLDDDYRE